MTTAGIGADMDDAWSIYTIPQFSMINKAWLDELGLPVPTTLDEFHDALKAFKDNDMSTPTMETQPVPPFPCPPALMSGAGARTSFYSGFGFTNWPNDVCNDLHLKKRWYGGVCLRLRRLPGLYGLFPQLVQRGPNGCGDVQPERQPADGQVPAGAM